MKKLMCLVLSLSIFFGGLAPCFAADFTTGSSISFRNNDLGLKAATAEINYSSYLNSIISLLSSESGILSAISVNTSNTYSVLNTGLALIRSDLQSILTNGLDIKFTSPFVPYFMPDPNNFDYTGAGFREFTVYSANNDGVTSTSRNRDNFIRILRDYLGADNALFYQSFRRLFNYVITSDYANENYQKVFNMNTGVEYSLPVRSIWVDIRYINRYLTALIYRITGEPLQNGILTKYDNTTFTADKTLTLKQYFYILGETISRSLGRLAYVLASDEDIEIREDSDNVRNTFANDFINSSGSGSASISDYSSLANGSSSIKSGLNSSYGVSDITNSLSNSNDGRWIWFSQTTLNYLNSTGQNNRNLLKSNKEYTSFYDDRYNMINHD